MDEETGLKAREFLLRSKIYRFVALLFAILGVVVFIWLYFRHFEGEIMQAATSIWVVPIVILPFLPAFVLSWIASRAEKKLVALLAVEKDREQK